VVDEQAAGEYYLLLRYNLGMDMIGAAQLKAAIMHAMSHVEDKKRSILRWSTCSVDLG
jgi:hypothetical protein